MKYSGKDRLRNILSAEDKNYSVKDFLNDVYKCSNRPRTLITNVQGQIFEKQNEYNFEILRSPDKNILSNPDNLNSPFLLFLETGSTATMNFEEYKPLFVKTSHILLRLPTESFNKEINLFTDLVEYISSMNFSILDIFGGYSTHHWQPDNMFGKIYIAFINNNCNIN